MGLSHVSTKNSVMLLKQQLLHRGWVDILSSGYSMYPFIRQGDVCLFVPAEQDQLRIGDVLLFESGEGSIIGHRLLRVEDQNGHIFMVCKGDANLLPDAETQWSQVLAVLAKIKRTNRQIIVDRKLVRYWGKFVVRVPVYSRIIRAYLNFRMRMKSIQTLNEEKSP